MNLASSFIQSSFGLSPSEGFPSYPDPSMAAVVMAQVKPSTKLKFGVWDGLANGGGWGFSDNDLIYVFGELETKYTLCNGKLPGAIDIGAGYSNGATVDGIDLTSGYGYYFQLEQVMYRENPHLEDDSQGLGFFASWFPKVANDQFPVGGIKNNYVVGVVYQGLLSNRNDDVVGLGVADAGLFQSGTNRETVVELFYRAQLTPSINIQPDIQYIASPSGIHPDSLAVGVRFQLSPAEK